MAAHPPLRNYLRTQRKSWALSQKQLAKLLGYRFPTHLSKCERDERLPSLKTALACEVVFGVPVRELFAGVHFEVQEDVMRRAKMLFESVEHRTDLVGLRKRELLLAMLARATDQANPETAMHHIQWDGRVLSIYATSRGLAYAVFEQPQKPVDWGVKSVRHGQKNLKSLAVVEELVARYQPDVLVVEDSSAKGSRRSERIRRLYRSIEALAASQVIDTHRYSREQLRRCFDEGFGAWRKQEIAQAIATLLPELAHRLPPVRKLWQSEDLRMGIFDAAALACAFFRFDAVPEERG